MRFLVTGSRDWPEDYGYLIADKLNRLPQDWQLINGACKDGGVDIIAHDWWLAYERVSISVPARWSLFKSGAGPIRNQKMLDDWLPKLVMGFIWNLETTKGTKDMLQRALRSDIKTIAYKLATHPIRLELLSDEDWKLIKK